MSMRVDSPDVGNHHQALSDLSDKEIKKQSEQAKRLGNVNYRNHPQLHTIKNAVQSLQPEMIYAVVKHAQQGMNGSGTKVSLQGQELPQLQSPITDNETKSTIKARDKSLTASAELLELLGMIGCGNSNAAIVNMQSKAALYNLMMSDTSTFYTKITAQLELLAIDWASALDLLNEAKKQAADLSDNVNSAKSALDSAEANLASLQAQAAEQNPVSDDLKDKLSHAKLVVDDAKTTLVQTQVKFIEFSNKTLKPASSAENNLRVELDNMTRSAELIIGPLTTQQLDILKDLHKTNHKNTHDINFLMALIAEFIGKSNDQDLKAASLLKEKLAESAAKDAEKKAKEFDIETRKAAEMQKTMGCVGKALGWLITGIGFAAAAFTGGASLALAGVGLALAVGDEIDQAVTGHSFIADAMNPVMNGIVKPMMELIGKMYTDILEKFGVDKNTAEMIGNIMGAIATAVLMVVGTMLAGSALSNIAAKTMAMAVEKEVVKDLSKQTFADVTKEVMRKMAQTIQRLLDKMMNKVGNRLFKGFGKSLNMDENRISILNKRMEQALMVSRVSDTVIQTSGNIAVAAIQLDATKIKAELMLNMMNQNKLNFWYQAVIETYIERMKTTMDLVKEMSGIASERLETGKFITRGFTAAG